MVDRAQAAVRSAQASLMQARAGLAQTEGRLVRLKLEYDRNKKLWEQKVISDADWDLSRTNYQVGQQEAESAKANIEAGKFNVESARAGLKDALENLRKTEIFAPVSGTVSKLTVEKGERVVGTSQMTGTEIMRLANLHNMEALVDVNENDIVRLTIGDTADIDVDSYSSQKRKFKGIVTSVANTAKTAVTSDVVTEFEVKVRILPASYADLVKDKGNASPFRPGMTAAVEIITERRDGILTVPLTSVTTRQDEKDKQDKKAKEGENKDGPKVTTDTKKVEAKEDLKEVVFVYEKGIAKKRIVKTGISDFENIQILEGLKEGEEVISGPFLEVSKRLKDGKKVNIKKDQPKKGNDAVADDKSDN
jgi:HlyD family secretion protein